ncbi:cytochrome c peroxidase [Pontibacter sp. G13]|uniref:cytochrome-c peroxidase n=1 Tax=Pontibacter sp. G13 TaxID=3074898 RepID=UPI0028899B7B|nr:cytochrome c peroxidase [Pontibacter sp. G13]WNJ16981.1 cytochrome c peroxidase [Pontibacter sp. G13]
MKFFLVLAGSLVACIGTYSWLQSSPEQIYANEAYSGIIDLTDLLDYSNQPIPAYINQDNTPSQNPITDAGATLGRVLFYDKALSVDNTIACGSCHQQTFGFSDTAQASQGVNGLTGRHSMRLVNARFGNEPRFFWDERASTLEEQTTQPIQDHAEMGFSGTMGDPGFDSLITKLELIEYYPTLFEFAFGSDQITENRIQLAMAQFIRSIQSFDSEYDAGVSQVNNPNQPFPNFTNEENAGKNLFTAPPQFDPQGERIGGGAGCQGCHQSPTFSIQPNRLSNGVVRVIGDSTAQDFTITRSPSLRDLVGVSGATNGPMMHTGDFHTIRDVINHYDSIPDDAMSPQLDPILRPGGNLQRLNLTEAEKDQLEAFLLTLSGTNVYVDDRWSDPFDPSGNLAVLSQSTSIGEEEITDAWTVYPSHTTHFIHLTHPNPKFGTEMRIVNLQGQTLYEGPVLGQMDVSHYARAMYLIIIDREVLRFVKQ